MPVRFLNGIGIHYDERGPAAASETVVFSHGLLWSGRMFEAQMAALSRTHRCIAYDHRGQGRSDVPAGPLIDMETLYLDAVALIEALVEGPVHFVGLSMGGFVGMRLAARRPDLVRSLTLIATAADPEPLDHVPKYRMLSAATRLFGPRAVSKQVMPIMFGESFLQDPSKRSERERWEAELLANERSIYKAVNGVIFRPGIEAEVARIETPTLVIRGQEDAAIAERRARALAGLIEGARFVAVPKGGHSVTVENPEPVNEALRDFLTENAG